MSQRTEKVASLVQQVVAGELRTAINAPEVSVTGVDVSPDLRQATVWIGIVADESRQKSLFDQVQGARGEIQAAVARQLSTKFVPRITFKHDTSGDYADKINRLIRGL